MLRKLWRWLQVSEFEAARMQQASSAAVSTLLKVMVDPHSPAACRVRAADSVLKHAAKAIETEDVGEVYPRP
jgi:hypothetical protein